MINNSGRNLAISQIFGQRWSLSEGSTWGYFFWLGLASCASHSIRLQDFLIINISGRNQWNSQMFCMKITIKGRQHVRLPVLFDCGNLCFSSSQIAGFFDYQYMLKESSDLGLFLHGDSHQAKVVPQNSFFFFFFFLAVYGLFVMSLIFCVVIIIKGWQHLRLQLLVGCGQPVRFHDSLIINISGKNQLIFLSDHCQSFICLFSCIIKCSNGPFSYNT